MIRHHTGSGRATVIPADWAAHHRPVAAGGMTATIAIRLPGGTPSFNEETGQTTTTPFAPYLSGRARIQVAPVFGGGETVAGGQEITTVSYLVALELEGSDAIAVNHLVDVMGVDDNGGTDLVGRTLKVESVARGSLLFERDLVCIDDLG